MKRTCIQCGKEFELSDSEISFYKKKNLSIPKRCEKCRELNKKQRDAAAVPLQEPVKKTQEFSGNTQTEPVKRLQEERASFGASRNRSHRTNPVLTLALIVIAGILWWLYPQQEEKSQTGNTPQVYVQEDQVLDSGTYAEDFRDKKEEYSFRNSTLLEEHYEKHGIEMGFASAQEYVEAANRVIASPNALHKLEEEDGDGVYYLEETNEFVIVSTDGYIRTYFAPEDGLAYYERQ